MERTRGPHGSGGDRSRDARTGARLAGVFGAALLAACGSAPPRPDPATVASTPASTVSPGAVAFQRRLSDKALRDERQGHLADAATSLEILALLAPDDPGPAKRLADVRQKIAAALGDRLRHGADALKRSLLDTASGHYLAALALDPGNAVAADAMRTIERARNRRVLAAKQAARRPPAQPENGD